MSRRLSNVPIHAIGQHCAGHEVRDFKAGSFEQTACTNAEFEERHRHDFFEVVWLKNGRGIHQIDLRDHPYQGSVVFVLSPGQIHHLRPATHSEGYLVKFRPSIFGPGDPFLDLLLETFMPDTDPRASPVIPLPKFLHAHFEDMFSGMVDEFNAPQRDSHHVSASYLRILLTRLHRLRRDGSERGGLGHDQLHTAYRALRVALERHHRAEHTVRGYARMTKISPRVLSRAAQRYAGKSIRRLIADRLVLEAQRELYHGDGSVKALSYALGFSDPAYFTRFFRKQTGESPQMFRRRIRVRFQPLNADNEAPAP